MLDVWPASQDDAGAVARVIHVPAHNTPIKASRREALLIAIAKARTLGAATLSRMDCSGRPGITSPIRHVHSTDFEGPRYAQHRDAEGPIGQPAKYELVINKTAKTALFWRFPKTTQSRYTDSNALKRSPSAMRLGWRAATGMKTVQSCC